MQEYHHPCLVHPKKFDYIPDYNTLSGPNPEDSEVFSAHYRTHFSDRWIRDETRVTRDGASWVPALVTGQHEILRVKFSAAGRKKGAGRGRKSAMKISFTAPPDLLEALRETGELRAATVRRLVARRGERRKVAFNLPVSHEDDLAEGVAMALLLQARL